MINILREITEALEELIYIQDIVLENTDLKDITWSQIHSLKNRITLIRKLTDEKEKEFDVLLEKCKRL